MIRVAPIRTKKDYKNALLRVEELIAMNSKKGTDPFDELDVLGTLLSAYEDIHFVIAAPDAVQAVSTLWKKQD